MVPQLHRLVGNAVMTRRQAGQERGKPRLFQVVKNLEMKQLEWLSLLFREGLLFPLL